MNDAMAGRMGRATGGGRYTRRAVLGAILALAVTGTAVAQSLKVTLGTGRDPNLGAPIMVAADRGFFKDAGVEVDLKFFPTGGDLMTAFAGGSVQMGSSGSTPLTTLRARPYPVKVVARVADISGAQQLIVRQDVKSLDQLAGKKIGIMRSTGSEAVFNAIVKNYGFDASKVELVNMSPTEMIQAFVRGQVDAISLWEPHTTRARKAGNGKILVSGTQSFLPGKEGANKIYGDNSMLFATEAFVKENPKVVQAVLTALVRATDYMEKNREATVAYLAKEFKLEPADMSDVYAANRYTAVIDDGLMADLNTLSDAMLAAKRIPAAVKASDWVDPAPLRAVRADLVRLK
jgi:aliphatic sulfonates family ABC transporter substrate-binding protein